MKVLLDKATAAKAIGNFDWFKIVPASSSKLTWTTVAAAPEGLAEAQSAVIDGKMYVFGGFNITTPDFIGINHAYVYDPAANKWAQIADLPAALTHTGVASDGHYAYIAGGYISDLTTQELTYASTNVWRYDPQTDTYSPFVPLPEARGAGAMVYLDGELHYFGGVDLDREGQTEHWILDLNDADPEWTAAAPMPFTRNHLAAVVLNDHIYAIGGQEGTDDKIPDPDVLMYWDPSNPDQWTHVADLPAGRSHMAAISTGSHIIVMAGEGDGGVILSSTLEYDPTTNAWTQMTSMPGPRLAPVAEYINGKIVFALGYSLQGLQKTTWISNAII